MPRKCCVLTIVSLQILTVHLENPNTTTLKPLQALPIYSQLTNNPRSILLCHWQEMPQSRNTPYLQDAMQKGKCLLLVFCA